MLKPKQKTNVQAGGNERLHMNFAYVYRHDCSNPGDLYSTPMHYLGDDYQGIIVDVFTNNIPEIYVDVVIIGGGALMTNNKFVKKLEICLSKIHAKKKIVWSVGFDPNNVNFNIKNNFDLFSTRENNLSDEIEWVPCVSCLHKAFDDVDSIKPTKDFLIVDHFKRSIEFKRPHTRIINKPNSINNILEAISDHRVVVTSSYHVAYWATLMKKKINCNRAKFTI